MNMGHNIDLSKYKTRTDLAIEVISNVTDGITSNIYEQDNIKITDVYINNEAGKKINKKMGNYITIEFEDITDYDNSKKVESIFSEQLENLLKKMKINTNQTCLVVGLGNSKSTPDSLGPLSINNILVTNHLFLLGEVENGFRSVSAIAPGVLGQTGLETSEILESIVNKFKPDFLIVIDALASQSIERVNRTIQMTDTGIHPGSGVGNSRKEISKDTLGIPCIAIGVPTVVDAITIVSDTINYMHKHYSYSKANINNPLNKLMTMPNYLNKKVTVNPKDKEVLLIQCKNSIYPLKQDIIRKFIGDCHMYEKENNKYLNNKIIKRVIVSNSNMDKGCELYFKQHKVECNFLQIKEN